MESFDLASTLARPDLRIQIGSPEISIYTKTLKHDDVVIVPEERKKTGMFTINSWTKLGPFKRTQHPRNKITLGNKMTGSIGGNSKSDFDPLDTFKLFYFKALSLILTNNYR